MTHRQTQHRVDKGGLVSEVDKADKSYEPRTYRLAFPVREVPRPCPVKGCSGRASTLKVTRVHFWHWHVRDTVVILE